MALYINSRQESPFVSLEFAPTLDGNFSFLAVKDKANLPSAKEQLAKLQQEILAETTVNGQPMLVTHGRRTDYSMLAALNDAGSDFKIPEPERKIEPWKLRGWASMIGQPMQLLSAWLKPKGIDTAIAGFATLNIIANIANIAFGAEESKDTDQLRYLKREFNYKLSKYLPEGASSRLSSSYDNRVALREGKEAPVGLGTRVYRFLRHYSVSFCEIGLRYVGAIVLIFPIDRWRLGFTAFGKSLEESKKGGYAKAVAAAAHEAFNQKDRWNGAAGVAYVIGKSIAFTAKVPDPYAEPPYGTKPHTWLDTIREKFVFPFSSAVEAVAAAVISWNALFMKEATYNKIGERLGKLAPNSEWAQKWAKRLTETETVMVKDKPVEKFKFRSRDWLSGIGGALFTFGLITRIFAKFGTKEVDLKELNAHIEDGLAQVPRDKLPQLVADFAAELTEHFKGKVQFGEVAKQLVDGLYRYHQISMPNLRPTDQLVPAAAPTAAAEATKTFAQPDMKKSTRPEPPAPTFVDKMAVTPLELAARGA